MSLDGEKYRSEVFKIMGLSLMTPMGRFILSCLENGLENITMSFYIDLIGSMLLLLAGMCFIQKGYEIADGRGEI